jgi:hypothetical protein
MIDFEDADLAVRTLETIPLSQNLREVAEALLHVYFVQVIQPAAAAARAEQIARGE